MSGAPVDVLAAMARDIIGAHYDWEQALLWRNKQRDAGCGPEAVAVAQQRADTLQAVWARKTEARAAVEEMLEAAKFARHVAAGPTGYTDGADRRLAAAIARVEGTS